MTEKRKLTLRCPECRADLVLDAATGEVLFHKAAEAPAGGGKDIETLLEDMRQEKSQAEAIFDREFSALEDRERLLEEKFDEAMDRARDEPEDTPPPRPFDLD